jgi:hypothetical protein
VRVVGGDFGPDFAASAERLASVFYDRGVPASGPKSPPTTRTQWATRASCTSGSRRVAWISGQAVTEDDRARLRELAGFARARLPALLAEWNGRFAAWPETAVAVA